MRLYLLPITQAKETNETGPKHKTPFDKTKEKKILKFQRLESSTPSPSPTTSSATSSNTTAASTTLCFLARLVLGLRLVVDEEGIQGQTVGENVVPDRGAADVNCVEGDGVAALGGHLDGAQGGVHLRRDGGDGAVENCSCFLSESCSVYKNGLNRRTILQLDCHRLVGAFHQKAISRPY